MPCKAGPDFNAENMTAMISEWQKLITGRTSWSMGLCSSSRDKLS